MKNCSIVRGLCFCIHTIDFFKGQNQINCIDFSWQRKFIERLLIKLSTRIRNSHKSKQDKKEMRENIRKKIQFVKENLSLVRNFLMMKYYYKNYLYCNVSFAYFGLSISLRLY